MDNNNITKILKIGYIIKTTSLIVVILCLSYFFGLFWYIIVQKTNAESPDNFIATFEIEQQGGSQKIVTLTYFAFTTLSTVGLGDMHPRSDIERAIGSFVLLFGVAVTSFIMDHFSKILIKMK